MEPIWSYIKILFKCLGIITLSTVKVFYFKHLLECHKYNKNESPVWEVADRLVALIS